MAVCCGADLMATKVGEAKPVMQRLVEELPDLNDLNAWCLGEGREFGVPKIALDLPRPLVLILRYLFPVFF